MKKLVAIAALGACGIAQADVLNFEGSTGDSPFIQVNAGLYASNQFGQYWVESYGGRQEGDLVGSIIDGSDNGLCMLACPVNNASHYYAALDDGYFYFGRNDNAAFRMSSLQASFIGAGQTYSPISGLLVLQGFNSDGGALGSAMQIGLDGPDVTGVFSFGNFDLSNTTFGNTYFSFVRVLGFSCDSVGSCNRVSDLANFAVDDIVTVPEPTTWALLGLGLAGMGVCSRKRSA